MLSEEIITLAVILCSVPELEATLLNPKTAVADVINRYGYPMQQHTITTEDGYILNVHRIPHGLYSNNTNIKPPVLMVHGLFGSGENWIMMGPNESLAFILADNGYDVWLAQARGSTHSRKHVWLNPDTDWKYWDFSWHEIGVYDLPATIDYIINETNQKQVFYVGHSQGCTSFFAMAADRPEINNKIRLMIGLAPEVLYVYPFSRLLISLSSWIVELTKHIPIMEILPNRGLIDSFKRAFCTNGEKLCFHLFALILGSNPSTVKSGDYSTILSIFPAGASTKQLVHYVQLAASDYFRHYDYGPRENIIKYNSTKSPRYDIQQISVPVALFYSKGDLSVSITGVEKLKRVLSNVVYSYLIEDLSFGHLSFLLNSDIVADMHKKILNLFKTY